MSDTPFWLSGGRGLARRLFQVLLLGLPALAHCTVMVVTTTADLRSMTEALGGERVHVTSLVANAGDAETYVPRPQDIERLRQAQLVVRVGVDYDLWLDRLITKTANPSILRGAAGYVDASHGITLLEVKTGGIAAGGHSHGAGNPHYWLDPENATIISANITGALALLDPSGSQYYERMRNVFLARLKKSILIWQQKLAHLNRRPILVYHNSWPYFARRFRLNFAAAIEPRPGVAPSPAGLARLLRQIREEHIQVIVRKPQEPSREVDFLAAKTGARVVLLAASVGDTTQAGDYFSLFDANVGALAAAYASSIK